MGWIADLLKEIPSAARYKAELEEMEKENASLKVEKAVLQSQVADLRQEIQRRDEVIKKETSHGQHLEEVREKLLVALSAGGKLQADQLAQAVGIGEQLATFHLNEMKEARLVSAAMFYGGRPTVWSIAQEGRSYLVAHGLLT